MTATPRLGLSYLVSGQAQKEVTHNDALNDLDVLAQTVVKSRSLTVPPSSPANGDTYIVGSSATGAWSGYDTYIASYYSGWRFKAPATGWRVWSVADGVCLYYTGSKWSALAAPYLDGTLSWTPGTIATGAGVSSSAIAISGAVLGGFVSVSAPYDLKGIMATAYVSATDQVVIRLHNATGASVALASGLWRVRVTSV